MLRIIVDGSADMPDGWAEEYQFEILPMPIQIGEKTYYQGEDIDTQLFYELLEDKSVQPKSAAPSPTRIAKFIEKVADFGDTVLSLNVSGKMSSTVTMARHAARDLKDKMEMVVFDSEAGSAVLAFMAREARLREKAGESLEEILSVLERIRDKVMVVLTVDSLEFARRSGRVGTLKAALTSLLKIKPIVTLHEGALDVSELVRTRRKSLESIVSQVQERFGKTPVKVAIVHAHDQESADILKEMVEKALNTVETVFTELSISVAANLGPKTVGIVAMPDQI
jgi:DegV family protein with EDD domain